jgi:hypothetical protein
MRRDVDQTPIHVRPPLDPDPNSYSYGDVMRNLDPQKKNTDLKYDFGGALGSHFQTFYQVFRYRML